jgi:peptide-methionine (R)-S-oxide reductase
MKSDRGAGTKTGTEKFDEAELRRRLTPLQYACAREAATERAFGGAYWDNHTTGQYRCVVCGEVLFDSGEKFDSGSGWPSFWDVVDVSKIVTRPDTSHGMNRTEVVCGNCGSHLGHLFNDGPRPTGLRYCINSASLDFERRTE